jgi:hypothetical protein
MSFSRLPTIDGGFGTPTKVRFNSKSASLNLPFIEAPKLTEDIHCVAWLTEIGMEQYVEAFITNLSTDGIIVLRRRLVLIRQQDLPKMNIVDFDHQKYLMQHIHLVLQHPFHSKVHRKASKMIDSPIKKSPARGRSMRIGSEEVPACIEESSMEESEEVESIDKGVPKTADERGKKEPILISKDTKAIQKAKAKASRRRRSFNNSVWQSIDSLRTKEKSNAVAAAHLRQGIFTGNSPSLSEAKSESKKEGGRRRWSFPASDDASTCGEVKNIHDKAAAYGNLALEFDMLQSSLKSLELEYLSKFCSMLNCEKASIFFVNEDTHDLLLFADNKTWYRIPRGSGLVGFCAETGQSLNIPDCYADSRFNQ